MNAIRQQLRNSPLAYSAFLRAQRRWNSLRRALPSILADSRETRRIQVFCLGAPKTGTTSMAALFEPHYRSAHEPLHNDLTHHFWSGRRWSLEDQAAYYRRRDKVLNLEVEASHLLLNSVAILRKEFPRARFILTVRDCYSCVESWVNHLQLMYRFKNTHAKVWAATAFAEGEKAHPKEEAGLREAGLDTLDAYFRYWNRWNRTVLDSFDANELLVLKTSEISQRLDAIAAHCGIDASTLNEGRSWRNQAAKKAITLESLDLRHVEEVARRHCTGLMEQLFPGQISLRSKSSPR